MKLSELAKASGVSALVDAFSAADGQLEITGVTADSRHVKPGNLFVALKGTARDGAEFISGAIQSGAATIVTHSAAEVGAMTIPVVKLEDPRLALSRLAGAMYDGQPKTMVAVTGTAGKTSVAAFTRQIWEHAGLAAASIGTTGVIAPGIDTYGNLTTPDPVALHTMLTDLKDKGVTHAAMEASSHGLDQFRLDGVKLSAAGFTNLGHDHLDYHPTMDAYFAAKMRLFEALLPEGGPAIVFADDGWSERAVKVATKAKREPLTVGRNGKFICLKRVEHEKTRQFAELTHQGKHYRVAFPLAGDFQIANALVAAGMAIATGSNPEQVFHALESLKGAPGRLELVGYSASGASAYVDYAHKPEALENMLASLRPFTTGKLICVFGCGGDRDKGKRPIMGEIAQRLADIVIVTDDNPRSEDPASIRAAIMAAATGATEIGDRATAIQEAVAGLGQGDCLVIAGKGHETGQTIGETTHPFSDHEVLRQALIAAGGRAA